jgi:serine/threonine protein kinase
VAANDAGAQLSALGDVRDARASAVKPGTLVGSAMEKKEDNVPIPIEDEKTSRSDPSGLDVSDSQLAEVEVHTDSQLMIELSASSLHAPADAGVTLPGSVARGVGGADELRAGEEVLSGRYRLLKLLGKGGMGDVHLAEDLQLGGARVAVKRMMGDLEREQDLRKRFVREAQLAARINHPNVVRVFNSYETDGAGHPYYVQEYLDGAQTLAQLLKTERRLDPERAVHIARQVAGGLEAAHRLGIIHRDIKLANVMVRAEDHVTIIDFGIGKDLGSRGTKLTLHGQLAGSVDWLEPAAFNSDFGPDARTDVYAIGMLLYILLTGTNPFAGLPPGEKVAKKMAGPLHIGSVLPTCPSAIGAIIERATAVDRERRYADAGELRQALIDFEVCSLSVDTVVDGRYVIKERLGVGGQGVVYRVQNRETEQQVALKLPLLATGDIRDARERFAREARLGQDVAPKDARLVQVFDWGTWRERPYFTMELLEGMEPLSTVSPLLMWPEHLHVWSEVAGALDTLAAHEVVHRDVTPSNIWVAARGQRVKLADLGLARELKADLTASSIVQLFGTVGYVAPEQYEDPKAVEPTTDQWALAAHIYKILTGRLPYVDVDVDPFEAEARLYERLGSDSTAELLAPHVVNPTVPLALSNAVMRALSRDPAARFATSSDFVRVLRAVPAKKLLLAHELDQHRAEQPTLRKRVGRVAVGMIAIVVTAGAIAAGGGLVRHKQRFSGPSATSVTTKPPPRATELPSTSPASIERPTGATHGSAAADASETDVVAGPRPPATGDAREGTPSTRKRKHGAQKGAPAPARNDAEKASSKRSTAPPTPYSFPNFGDE